MLPQAVPPAVSPKHRRGLLRLALMGPYPFDPTNFEGGVEAAFHSLVEGLTTLGDLEIHVATLTSDVRRASRIERDGVVIHRLPSPSRLKTLSFHLKDRQTVRHFLDQLRPDVVHAQQATDYGYVCLKAGRSYPVVVSIHGIVREEQKYLRDPKQRLRAVVASLLLERYCIRHARFLTQPTRYPERIFGPLVRGKIYDIGNAVASRYFDARPAHQPNRILYSGIISPRKRLLDLVSSLVEVRKTNPNFSLRVAGPADPDYRSLVEKRLGEYGLTRNVVFLGALSPEQMVVEYERAALLVLPSGQETSPMVIAEAMAAGVPAVATDVGGMTELVEPNVTGFLVRVGDTKALAEAIATLLGDEGLRSQMSARAKLRAERFRPSVVAERVVAIYAEAIAAESLQQIDRLRRRSRISSRKRQDASDA
jgi:glycosyltransferase involved in cell wall biosynthesis